VEDGAIFDDEFMKKFESIAKPVVVATDAPASVDVRITPPRDGGR